MQHWTSLINGRPLTRVEWEKTTVPIRWIDGGILPVGTEYKGFETSNHGWVVLRGADHERRIAQL